MKEISEKALEIFAWAMSQAMIKGLNPTWRRAYLKLADAAAEIDEMVQRTKVEEEPTP